MINGRTVAGPTGPPTIDQPDDALNVAPVEGAEVVIVDSGGNMIQTAHSDSQGHFHLDLPAGQYELRPRPVQGYLGLPEPVIVTVDDQADEDLNIEFVYDTGVR